MKTKEGFIPTCNVQSIIDNKHFMIALMDAMDTLADNYCLKKNVEAINE